MRALVLRNLRHQRRALLALALGMLLLEVGLLQIGASFERQGGLDQLLALLPPFLKRLLADQLAIASFPAMAAFGFQHPGMLLPSLGYLLVLGTLPAADREEGTLELFLARPLSRERYLAAQLLTALLVALLLPAATLAGVALGLKVAAMPDALPWTRYVICAVNMACLLAATGAFALLLAARAERRGPPLGAAAGTLLVLFVVGLLAPLSETVAAIAWLSPLHYFRPIPAAMEPGLPVRDLLVLGALAAGSAAAAFVVFRRRDL